MQIVPSWMVPWWNWWAAFTALLDWDAIAAMATAAALFWALWSAVSTRRSAVAEERLRSIRMMKALLTVCGSGIAVVRISLDEGKAFGQTPAQAAASALSVDSLNEVQRSLETLSPSDMHSTSAIDMLMSARSGANNLRRRLEEQAAGGDVGGTVSGILAFWDRLLLGLAEEVLRLGGGHDPVDTDVVTEWLTTAERHRSR